MNFNRRRGLYADNIDFVLIMLYLKYYFLWLHSIFYLFPWWLFICLQNYFTSWNYAIYYCQEGQGGLGLLWDSSNKCDTFLLVKIVPVLESKLLSFKTQMINVCTWKITISCHALYIKTACSETFQHWLPCKQSQGVCR